MTAQPPAVQPQPAPSAGQMTLGPFVSKAWALVTADLVLFIVSYLIVAVLCSIPLVGLIIGGPLMFGFLRIVQKRYKGEPAEIGQVFDGFKDFTKGLVTVLLALAASLCIVIPIVIIIVVLSMIPCVGAVLAIVLYICAILALSAGLYFLMPIAALSATSPMDAIKASIKFLIANIGPMVLLSVVTALISMAGAIACGVGVLFTVPLAMTISVIAYNEYYLPNAPAA